MSKNAPYSSYRVKSMNTDGRLSIGTLAQAAGVKVVTIRYYERIKLMPVPPRTEGNYRPTERSICIGSASFAAAGIWVSPSIRSGNSCAFPFRASTTAPTWTG